MTETQPRPRRQRPDGRRAHSPLPAPCPIGPLPHPPLHLRAFPFSWPGFALFSPGESCFDFIAKKQPVEDFLPTSTRSSPPLLVWSVQRISQSQVSCKNASTFFLGPCGYPFPRKLKPRLTKEICTDPRFQALFENILAIDVHTWHQPVQDRFLYLYIKIKKKTYKMFKTMFKAWEKSFLH